MPHPDPYSNVYAPQWHGDDRTPERRALDLADFKEVIARGMQSYPKLNLMRIRRD